MGDSLSEDAIIYEEEEDHPPQPEALNRKKRAVGVVDRSCGEKRSVNPGRENRDYATKLPRGIFWLVSPTELGGIAVFVR